MFSHIPAKLGLDLYTPHGLPTRYRLDDVTYQMVYFELVKQRSGASDLTIPCYNKLALFDFDEMERDVFSQMLDDAQKEGGVPLISSQKKLI
jgi:hypothetical protein